MRKIKWISLCAFFLFVDRFAEAQQLRLGDNPASVEKSAVLDLVSTNQGLLLPRLTDTAQINSMNPPSGMIIYYTPASKILVRTNGYWQPLTSSEAMRLSNLGDASITTPSAGQLLQYNGSVWVNTTPNYLSSIDTSNIANFSHKVIGLFSGTSPISISANGVISISQANTSTAGYLSSSDWNTFNNKQPADNYITALTGDITATGPGSVAATIAAQAVTYSKIQDVSASDRVLGRVSSGSGIVEEIPTTGTGNVVRANAPALINPTGIVKSDVGLGNVDNTSDANKPVSTATQSALNLKINLSEKAANNGVATLDAGGKVPISQMAVGAQVYKGVWSAATNTPTLSDAVGSAGDTYRVIETGTVNLGSGNITFYASDDVIHNGLIWQRNPATSDVTSVNGQAGTVVLTSDDVTEGATNKYYTDARANLKINVSEKGANNGVASLDAGGKVPVSQLPVGSQVYKGTWDANTNSPVLADGVGTTGWTYRITVAGTQNLGSGNITFNVGDDIIYNGTIWQRNPSSAAVTSVNTQTGDVVLTSDHISEGTTNLYFSDARVRSVLSANSPLSYNSSAGIFSIPQATSTVSGYLSSSDWVNFSTKQTAGNYITGLTGDVTATGPGSVGATIANNAVTYGKMQSMTANKLLGSGASGTAVSEITLGTGLSFTGSTLNAATTGGTVTSFSAGNLSPLFTTSVGTATTTPALSFSLSSQSPNLVFASPNSSSGTPTFRSLLKADLPSTTVYNDQSNTYTSGSKQIFSASSTNADIRLTGNASDPSSLSNGDIWYNSTSHLIKYRANGTTRVLTNLDEVQTLTNKTISGAANTITNIGNSSLTNSTIGLTLGSTGTDANVSGSPASLGGSLTLNLPTASSANRGLLSATDWNTFNSKGGGSVTSVSVNSSNGFAGTVGSPTSTPSITLSTTITGMLKGNGTALTAGISGTDYSAGTAALATGILKSTTSTGTLSIATASDFPTLNQNTTGNAATVTTNANLTGPVTSVGNATTITDAAITTAKLNANAVTYAKMQAMTANKLLGSGASGTAVSEITLGTGLSFTGTTLNAATGYESPLTFSSGLTRAVNDVTNDLITGVSSSNQTVLGSTASGGTLTLSSTSHATKGKLLFGTSAYDEVNNRLGIGTTSPVQKITIGGGDQESISRDIRTGSLEIMGGTSEATGAYFQLTGDQHTGSPYEGSAEYVIRNLTNSQFALFSYDGSSTWTQRFQLKGLSGDTYLVPNGGKLGIGTSTPTALMHLKAGTATANTAPLKFTSGTNLTTPENGAMEYNGTNLFITNGGARETILTSASALDTTYISNFYLKVRSLHSATSPLTYNSTTGAFGITQANTSTSGYLSSTDWNTFNNKQGSGNYLNDPGANGVVVRTALNTSTARTLTGTTNRLTISNGDGVSGNPTFDVGSNIVDETIANTYTAGSKQTFVNSATTSGINLTPSADPSTLASGDFWNSTTTANSLKYRDAATTTRTLVDLSLSQTLTNKSISGSTNTLTNIPNTALSNSSITVASGTSGTDVAVSGSPVSLGGTVTLNIPIASATNTGKLSATDWSTFNSKQSSGNYMTDPGSNGVVVRTALNTTTTRTLTGTSNRLSISNGDGVSGNPTFDVGTNIIDKTVANSYTGGAKQTFVNSATTSGFNLTASADPSTPASGDLWNSTTTANSLKYRDAATTTRTLVDLSLTQTLTNKSISGASNTLTAIPNTALSNSSITVATGTSGSDVAVSGSPVSLGGTVTLNIPTASASNTGKLSSTDWTTFNNKQSSGNYLTDPGGNGVVIRTALNTTEERTITGTTNRLTVTNGTGVSGNPTLDISSSYVGQSSITTLGTIGTGTWNGSIINSGYGGTGNGFTKFTGPASSEKTFTLPNVSSTILTSNAAVTVAQGGTGQTTANAAFNALVPSQTGNSGKVLTTDGSNTSWTSSTSPGSDDFIYSYTTSTKTFSTAGTWADITFNTAHPQLSGWTHSTSSNSQNFTCTQTGLYMISFNGQANNTSSTTYELSVRATLDGTEIAGSVASIQCSSSNPTVSNNFLASITSGQVLKLQLTGSNTAIQLSNGSYGTTKPSIGITVVRIN
ncbi:MAG TPA: hypothetical protein VLJ68_14195 [Chitinophagaceae bacterium]|nr:hypothetical protein [Chitinophagaceae bacterium]